MTLPQCFPCTGRPARRAASSGTGARPGLLAMIVVATLLAGCMVGPDYHRPDVSLPGQYPETLAPGDTSGAGAIRPDWWSLVGDPTLDRLVRAALARNQDILQAAARIEETDATLRAVNAAFIPEVDATAGAARAASVPPAGKTVANSLRVGLATSFEIDFWGRLRRGREAARASALATRHAAEVVAISTAGLTAQTYIALRSLDAQRAVTERNLALRTDAVRLVRRRATAGLVSDLDVNQAESARADAAAQLKEITRQRSVVLHALAVLTGEPGLTLPAGVFADLPRAKLPPPGVPSELLLRRPDVRQAEQELIAANARIGVASADQFPTISLTASVGLISPALQSLVDPPSRAWSFGTGLFAPIFDAGRRRALAEAEEARARQSLANYRRAIERAFREVADALVTIKQDAAAEADQAARVQAASNVLRLANLRYEAGYSAFLEVLDAQRGVNDAELAAIRNRQALLAAEVDLLRALGGGWREPDMAAPGTP